MLGKGIIRTSDEISGSIDKDLVDEGSCGDGIVREYDYLLCFVTK